jgi:RNA polymerase sigma factor (sigma-70 family)
MADHEEMAAIYAAHGGQVYTYVRARVVTAQDAEDLTAEVFLLAFRALGRFRARHDNATAAWLLRIAHNQVSNFHRRQRRAALSSLEELPMEPAAPDDPARAAEHEEGRRQLLALVASLSPRHQDVITLKYFAGLRNHEIAAALAIDQRTVAAYLTRALDELLRRIGGPGAAGAWELLAEHGAVSDNAADLRHSYTGLRSPAGRPPTLAPEALELALRAAAPRADAALRDRLLARVLAPRPGPLARIAAALRRLISG